MDYSILIVVLDPRDVFCALWSLPSLYTFPRPYIAPLCSSLTKGQIRFNHLAWRPWIGFPLRRAKRSSGRLLFVLRSDEIRASTRNRVP